MSGDAVELNADGGASGKQGKVGLNVAESEAATVKVVACSGAETLVDSAVNGLKEKAEGDEEVSMVELIDELKDAVEFSREQGGEEDEEEHSEKAELDASCEPSSSKGGGRLRSKFGDSDLVWAKVRSHPWWPGQVFDASMASDKAKKYMKKERHLIAYFGDQSFAWNEISKIKPFRTHFSQMSNQKNSNMEDFHDAVDDALDEVSRRVEFGLSCPCVAEHSRIRTQVIVNPGIKDECCRRDGSDRFSSVDSFEPDKLVECIKRLGRIGPSSLLNGVERLEFITARAQLLAFSRWKGFPELPELQVLGTVLNEAEAEADVPLSDRKENVSIIERDDKHGLSIKTYSSKRKRDSVVEGEQLPAKKERTLADYIAEMRSLKSNGKGKLNREETVKSAGKKKKRKAANSDAGFGFGAKKKRHDLSTPEGSKNIKRHDLLTLEEGSKNMVVETSCPKGSFGIGYSILKVVSQMNSPSPILKSHTVSSRKSKEKKGSKTEEKKKVSKTKEKKKKKGSEKKSAKPRSKRAPEDLDKGSDEVPESQVNSPPDVPNQKHREEASKVETEMQDEQEEGTEEENLSEGNGNSKVETEMQDEQEEGTDEENFPEGNEINGEARTRSDEVIQDNELLQLGAEQGDDASVPEQQNCDEYVDCVDAVKEQQELQSSVLGSA